MKRRLFLAAVIVVVGYVIGRADAAYGHAPWLILCLTALVSWLAGAAHAALPLTLAVAEANRERDDIAARLAQIEDGGSYVPRSVVAYPSKVTRLPRQRPDGAA